MKSGPINMWWGEEREVREHLYLLREDTAAQKTTGVSEF